jgi:2-phosphosulfolactate phosphatase
VSDARSHDGAVNVDVGWGPSGLRDLAPRSDVVIVVDVLRFTTAVDVAVARGARVYPYRWHDGSEAAYAEHLGAELAVKGFDVDDRHPWSLSPVGLAAIPAGTELVLPSPNGAALAFAARDAGASTVIAGCLRNAPAVGSWAASVGGRIGVLAAGERWNGATGPLRPALEDWLGAGAVASAADPGGEHSTPDALAAAGSFLAMVDRLDWALAQCASGRELRGHGWDDDVAMASAHGVSTCVPLLDGACFVDGSGVGRGDQLRMDQDRMGE